MIKIDEAMIKNRKIVLIPIAGKPIELDLSPYKS
jgi:hypothetical protein